MKYTSCWINKYFAHILGLWILHVLSVEGNEVFDVLKMNPPFPTSNDPNNDYAALLNATYSEDLKEMTSCFRFSLESYNDGWFQAVVARGTGGFPDFQEATGLNNGFEFDGFQGWWMFLRRNIPGGGLGKIASPAYFNHNPRLTIEISKWYHVCTSYSSTLHLIHKYINGLKVFTYEYEDEQEDPLKRTIFESVVLGINMRGLMTDFNLYSSYFSPEEMISWTSNCQKRPGEVFNWNINKLNITQPESSGTNVTFVQIDRSEVCDSSEFKDETNERKSAKSFKQTEKNRFQPKPRASSSFIGSVLELFPSPLDAISGHDAKDKCFRLNGELMMVPQSDEEEHLWNKTSWEILMKKAKGNVTLLKENYCLYNVWVAGETKNAETVWEDEGFYSESKKQTWPPNGEFKLFNPWTWEPIYENRPGEMIVPMQSTDPAIIKQCVVCFNALNKPWVGHFWYDKTTNWCHYVACTMRRNTPYFCIFEKEPTYTVRGLCKEAVMDTQFKLADHTVMDDDFMEEMHQYKIQGHESRSYVGPKGWTIHRNKTDKKWRMSHYYYTDQTLTMLDADDLPVGRHKWMVENNVCNEGKTSSEDLLISGCDEGEFTCDDGKCLNISQRCNNIEVSILYNLFKTNYKSYNRNVMM